MLIFKKTADSDSVQTDSEKRRFGKVEPVCDALPNADRAMPVRKLSTLSPASHEPLCFQGRSHSLDHHHLILENPDSVLLPTPHTNKSVRRGVGEPAQLLFQ